MYKKIWEILSSSERKEFVFLLILMVIGMLLETMGVGLVIPMLALLSRDDFSVKYPFLGLYPPKE